MSRPVVIALLSATLAALTFAPAGGVSGRGGFEALAVSADGKTIAVGGQNRVVYLVDTGGEKVSKRIWMGVRIAGLAFNADGTRLIVEDETATLHLLDPATGETLHKRERTSGLAPLPGGARALVRDEKVLAGNRLLVLSLDRLAEERVLAVEDPPVAWTVDSAGKRLTVLGRGVPSSDERRVPLSETPARLQGLDRAAFRLKNDGLRSALRQIDLATGKIERTQFLWYSSDFDSTVLARAGDVTHVFNRANVCARIAADGTVTLFQTPHRVNAALGVSPDGKTLLIGGLGEGSVQPLGSDLHRSFTLEPLPGQSEAFTRFHVADDGSAWAVTTAYRLVHISSAGKVDRIIPVY